MIILNLVNSEINCFIVPPHNPEILAEKIITLIKSKELRDKFKKNGLDTVSKLYDWSSIAQQFQLTLEEIQKKETHGNNKFSR